jgi:hypothetical protein
MYTHAHRLVGRLCRKLRVSVAHAHTITHPHMAIGVCVSVVVVVVVGGWGGVGGTAERRLWAYRESPRGTGIVGVNLGKNKDQTDAIADYVRHTHTHTQAYIHRRTYTHRRTHR